MILNQGTIGGRKYVSPAAIREMSTLQTGAIPSNRRGGFGWQGYGFGWTTYRPDGGPSGSGFGHLGARKTMLWIDPDRRLAVILIVQCLEITQADQLRLYAAVISPAFRKFGGR